VFFDPKSSESFTPHFSRGWRDDAIQRAYLEATWTPPKTGSAVPLSVSAGMFGYVGGFSGGPWGRGWGPRRRRATPGRPFAVMRADSVRRANTIASCCSSCW
jgi:hypothetical protein